MVVVLYVTDVCVCKRSILASLRTEVKIMQCMMKRYHCWHNHAESAMCHASTSVFMKNFAFVCKLIRLAPYYPGRPCSIVSSVVHGRVWRQKEMNRDGIPSFKGSVAYHALFSLGLVLRFSYGYVVLSQGPAHPLM